METNREWFEVIQLYNTGEHSSTPGHANHFEAYDADGNLRAGSYGDPNTGEHSRVQSRQVFGTDGLNAIELFKQWLFSGEPMTGVIS